MKKKLARFKKIGDVENDILFEALFDRKKIREQMENRTTLRVTADSDVFLDSEKFERVKKELLNGTGKFSDWGENIRFRAYNAIVGQREALAAGLSFTLSDNGYSDTGEPSDEEDRFDGFEKILNFEEKEEDESDEQEEEGEPTGRDDFDEFYRGFGSQ